MCRQCGDNVYNVFSRSFINLDIKSRMKKEIINGYAILSVLTLLLWQYLAFSNRQTEELLALAECVNNVAIEEGYTHSITQKEWDMFINSCGRN